MLIFERSSCKKFFVGGAVLIVLFAAAALFFYSIRPADANSTGKIAFEIKAGEGFSEIAGRLAGLRLIRSRAGFVLLSLSTGSAGKLKPGNYLLSPAMSSWEILGDLTFGSHREVRVTIPEGLSIYEVERVLSDAGVILPGSLIAANSSGTLEGHLFPDTYRFFTDSTTDEILKKFSDNFKLKAEPLLLGSSTQKIENMESNLILASIIQNEVPDPADQKIVAGILKKRIVDGIPLQVDATICYIKEVRSYPEAGNCYPLAPLDFKIDSAYNTYLHRGLPPGPIGNPGISAINAALNPQSSPYWFYLSDQKTGKTIFSKTLDEHEQNRVKYLRS